MSDKENRLSVWAAESNADQESLPALLERMTEHVLKLLDMKLSLLKVELKEEANAYVRGGVMIAAGGVIAAVGFALLNVAIAFLISTLFEHTQLSQTVRYALGFIITAVLYLVVGAIIIMMTKKGLAKQGLIPQRSVAELERDKQWLKKEI